MSELKTPELDKLAVVNKKSQIIGEFLEWLSEQGIELCYFHECGKHCDTSGKPSGSKRCMNSEQYCPGVPLSKEERVAEKLAGKPLKTTRDTESILASYFGINLDAVEDERRALLAHLRTLNERRA